MIKVASDDRCKILISSLQVNIKIFYMRKSFMKKCTNKMHSLSTILPGNFVIMKYLSGHFAWD